MYKAHFSGWRGSWPIYWQPEWWRRSQSRLLGRSNCSERLEYSNLLHCCPQYRKRTLGRSPVHPALRKRYTDIRKHLCVEFPCLLRVSPLWSGCPMDTCPFIWEIGKMQLVQDFFTYLMLFVIFVVVAGFIFMAGKTFHIHWEGLRLNKFKKRRWVLLNHSVDIPLNPHQAEV